MSYANRKVARRPKGRQPAESERALFVDGNRVTKPVSDVALFNIVDLMRVPATSQHQAALALHEVIEDISSKITFGTIAQNIDNLSRIGRLASDLLQELNDLNSATTVWITHGLDEPFSMDHYIEFTEALVDNATYLTKKKKAAHRPRGSVKHKLVNELISHLYQIARNSEGRLTMGLYMATHRPNGNLPKILDILHHHLPSIVPANIPYSTLHRMKRSALRQLANPKPVFARPTESPQSESKKARVISSFCVLGCHLDSQ